MNLVASQCQYTITASARLDTYMSLKVGGRAIGWVKFCGKARLKAKFANNRVLCGLFVLNRGTRKVGCGAKFGLVQALEQTESARTPQIACNSGTTKQPRQPVSAPAECRHRSNRGEQPASSRTAVDQMGMEIERQHGWSPEMGICRRRAGKAAKRCNAIRSRIPVELALLWFLGKGVWVPGVERRCGVAALALEALKSAMICVGLPRLSPPSLNRTLASKATDAFRHRMLLFDLQPRSQFQPVSQKLSAQL